MYTRCVFALVESKLILVWFVDVTQRLSNKNQLVIVKYVTEMILV